MLLNASQAYALDMFKRFYYNVVNENLVFSPLSLQYLMGMLTAGSDALALRQIATAWHSPNASTQQINIYLSQCAKTYQSISNEEGALYIANGAFINQQNTIDSEFQRQIQASYNATIQNIDTQSLQSADMINAWVCHETRGRIPQILGKMPSLPLSDAMLINTVYFKGSWEDGGFFPEQTSNRIFHGVTQNTKVLSMQRNSLETYYEDEQLQAIYLPYENNCFGFLIMLSHENGANGLDALMKKLDVQYFEHILHHTQSPQTRYSGTLYLPRFDISYTNDALLEQSQALLGVDLKSLEFPKILQTPEQMKIDKIIHTANITVDEEGTEASAVSGGLLKLAAIQAPPTPFIMDVNHPFAYALLGKDGQILFLGTMQDF